MGPTSPASSPRLPSPPPFTEVQIGPKSPGPHATSNAPNTESEDIVKLEQGAERRIRPGMKAADMAVGPLLKPLTEVDSAFQLQEHLKALFHHHTRSPDSQYTTTQLTHDTAHSIANPPNGVERGLWLYELCRLLVIKANQLIVQFFNDSPPCSAQTCPEMRASEWQYLCAVHEPPKPCCAIDYCCHTLDWAATTLASQKHFPSRLTLGNEASGGSQAGVRQLTNIMRRVYRIFAHAWFQHRPVFWQVESNEGLYMLFKTVCDVYSLIPEENYTIPPEAEGLVAKQEEPSEGKAVLQKKQNVEEPTWAEETDDKTTVSTGATTRRHKSTHSFSSSVAAIAEGDEEDSPLKEKTSRPSEMSSTSATKEAPAAQVAGPPEQRREVSPRKEANVQPPAEPPKDLETKEDEGAEKAQVPSVKVEESAPEPSTTGDEAGKGSEA